ncbi:MAG: phosphoribosyltransferase family protein [Microgenomates group bacterium]
MATRSRTSLNIFSLLKNLFFPKFCFGCKKIGTYLCVSCAASLKPIRVDTCMYCNKTTSNGLTHDECKKEYSLDGGISIFRYESLLQKIIKKIKYGLMYDAVEDIYRAIPTDTFDKIISFKSLSPNISFIPVPLHRKRKSLRGFNQSEKLFRHISRRVEIPLQTNIVIRKKYTTPQVEMKSKSDREKNIVDAFFVTKNVSGNDFIICDDVWTTGTTINELCKELKENGARNIYALTIARVYL